MSGGPSSGRRDRTGKALRSLRSREVKMFFRPFAKASGVATDSIGKDTDPKTEDPANREARGRDGSVGGRRS